MGPDRDSEHNPGIAICSDMDAPFRPSEVIDDPDYYRFERYLDRRTMSASLRAFYAIKPAVARRLQLALRRLYARRQARRAFPAWPIEPIMVERDREEMLRRVRAAPGKSVLTLGPWPHHRRFAVVLTHDVEGEQGIANIPAVRKVERRYGFVSCWNFVAEWYPIPSGLFDRLRDEGCEIGLHGVRHDGALFRDRASFETELPQIHRYLAEWGAEGFRSPATLRNADWMPELGCLYDSSFPDTDPFEPQPGGCCSILPFFIGPVVELPITLVQDHTLFEILRRRSIELWTEKTDWIIEHRGLVNLDVHPDYLMAPDRLALYERYLAYLAERIERDLGWHALPREVASWWRERAVVEEKGPSATSADGIKGPVTFVEVHEREGELTWSA